MAQAGEFPVSKARESCQPRSCPIDQECLISSAHETQLLPTPAPDSPPFPLPCPRLVTFSQTGHTD